MVEMSIVTTNATAKGGTERSWDWMTGREDQRMSTSGEMCFLRGSHTVVAHRADDGRCKVGETVDRRDEAKVHETAEENFICFSAVQSKINQPTKKEQPTVFHDTEVVAPVVLDVVVGLANVIREAGADGGFFLDGEKAGVLWEIREEEEPRKGEDAGEEALCCSMVLFSDLY
jgi:hypothetical protein